MIVSQCVCERIPFKRVLLWAKENNISTVDGIKLGLGCGKQCGLCMQFMEYALQTGVTEVPCPCPRPKPTGAV